MTDPAPYIGEFAAIARRMTAQAGLVAKNIADQVNANAFNADALVKSMTQLVDIATLGGIEVAENALAGPAAPNAPTTATSDAYYSTLDPSTQRVLSIETSFARLGTIDFIPNNLISFDPPNGTGGANNPLGVLEPDKTEFHVIVSTTNLPSGVYSGKVQVQTTSGPVSSESLTVVIAL